MKQQQQGTPGKTEEHEDKKEKQEATPPAKEQPVETSTASTPGTPSKKRTRTESGIDDSGTDRSWVLVPISFRFGQPDEEPAARRSPTRSKLVKSPPRALRPAQSWKNSMSPTKLSGTKQKTAPSPHSECRVLCVNYI